MARTTSSNDGGRVIDHSSFEPSQQAGLATDVLATFTFAISIACSAIAMAVLVFSGQLDDGLQRAIGSFVTAGGVMAIWIAARSRMGPVATIVQDGPAIVAAAVVADFAGRGDTQIADVFVLLALTTLTTGVVLCLLGHFRLGGLVRYMPSTVVGAFVAGTGWLLFKGGFDVMVGFSLGLADFGQLFTVELAQFWVPGFLFGIAAWRIGQSDRFPAWSVGSMVVAVLGGFYIVAMSCWSLEEVESAGWLIGPFPTSSGVTFVSPTELANTDWRATVGSIPGIASIVALSAVALLLNLTGLSAQLKTRADVDAELRTAGIANLFGAPFGASPGFHAMGSTLLLLRLGATRRLVPVAGGVILMLLGLVGVSSIGYVPRIIPGMVLVTVGVALLAGWFVDLMRTDNLVEQVLSVAILLVIASVGILAGIGVGVVAACAVFIVRYSRIDPVRRLSTGAGLRSRVDRSATERAILDSQADRLRLFELQGYLFFGSLVSMERQLRAEVLAEDSSVDALVIDFAQVTGVEPAGYDLLANLLAELDQNGVTAIASSLAPRLQAALTSTMRDEAGHVASTLDDALEMCEQAWLEIADPDVAPQLADIFAPRLQNEFTTVQLAKGTVAMAQGSASDGFLIVESGQLTVARVDEDGIRHRLRRLGALGIVGEIGVITGVARTAEVVAETDVVAWSMSAGHYRTLRSQQPELIVELHEFIMGVQAKRVIDLSPGRSGAPRGST